MPELFASKSIPGGNSDGCRSSYRRPVRRLPVLHRRTKDGLLLAVYRR
jgi:hypothetical protein